MKILHTSDWHLGKRLERFSRQEEQEEVCREITAISKKEKTNLVLLCGDLFDTFNPPTAAVDLFYRTLKTLTRGGECPVIGIAGNHDSPERIEAPDPLARSCGILLLGYPDTTAADMELEGGGRVELPEAGIILVHLPGHPPVRIIHTPYANEFRLRKLLGGKEETGTEAKEHSLRELLARRWRDLGEKYFDDEGINLLMGHLFIHPFDDKGTDRDDTSNTDIEEPEGEKSILHPGGLELIPVSAVPRGTQYAAFGHLHRPKLTADSPCPVVYSGSPLAYSLSESADKKSLSCIEARPGEPVSLRRLPLTSGKPLYKKQFSSVREAEAWLKEHLDCYVDCTVKTPDYIRGEDKKRLFDIHKGILRITPDSDLTRETEATGAEKSFADVNKPMKELFIEYFTQEHNGTPPNKELLSLFDEIVHLNNEEKDT